MTTLGAHRPYVLPQHLNTVQQESARWNPIAEKDKHREYIQHYINALIATRHETDLTSFSTFLPPRLVRAAKDGLLVPFFGAGASVPAGIPTWQSLLEQLGVSRDTVSDPQLSDDPLTAAELIAHEIGYYELQESLRAVMLKPQAPSLLHYILAQLLQPVYLTTNYDVLLEQAWHCVHGEQPIVVTNDADLYLHKIDIETLAMTQSVPVVVKLHGCASRRAEEMILTRKQYRHHYRANPALFKFARNLMLNRQVLFLGFGHRDAEISRQVEDVIYTFETAAPHERKCGAFYSLQFDMRERTPEVFAARGIVALQPPLVVDAPADYDYRSAGLAKAMVDLVAAMDSQAHASLDLATSLAIYSERLSRELEAALNDIAASSTQISAMRTNHLAVSQELQTLQELLNRNGRSLASQGVYLLSSNGDIEGCSLPQELVDPRRKERRTLSERYYVRQARTYRHKFVSDCDKSVFNGQSTFFLCCPLGTENSYHGLLFAAAQVGQWQLPQRLASEFWAEHRDGSFVLVDSNGVVLLPPNRDSAAVVCPLQLPRGEQEVANQGYVFEDLRRLSRRDRLVSALWKNVVPLAQDDDVRTFEPDLTMYSVAAEVPHTRWKLALSMPYPRKALIR